MSWRPVVVAVVLGLGLRSVEALAGARQADFDPRFAPTISNQFNGKPMRLILTGTAVRTKYGFRVYAIGSYVQEGVKVHTGEELVRVSAAKQLHLIFEREVDGATMARSFASATVPMVNGLPPGATIARPGSGAPRGATPRSSWATIRWA